MPQLNVLHGLTSGKAYGLPSSAMSSGMKSASARQGALTFKVKDECCNRTKAGSLILLRLGLHVLICLDVRNVELSIAVVFSLS